jgi:hypothetical protein
MCKKCRKAFRKDMTKYEESDEYCPHCDNHYVRALFLQGYTDGLKIGSLGHTSENSTAGRWLRGGRCANRLEASTQAFLIVML